jgi:hypothetical protein
MTALAQYLSWVFNAITMVGVLIGIWTTIRGTREMHVLVNSRLTELLKLTAQSSEAKGRLEEKRDQYKNNEEGDFPR